MLDMYGADLNCQVGKFKQSAFQSALLRWNVRIIDYLMERNVNPFLEDAHGFTAKRLAEIKQLRTIASMLADYENKFGN